MWFLQLWTAAAIPRDLTWVSALHYTKAHLTRFGCTSCLVGLLMAALLCFDACFVLVPSVLIYIFTVCVEVFILNQFDVVVELLYLLIVCWTCIATPLWCRYTKWCRMNALFFILALHISLVVVGIFLFLFFFFFCRCWLSIGSLVAYWSPVEGHSCFRDVNTTVILQAADSRNYVPVILAT